MDTKPYYDVCVSDDVMVSVHSSQELGFHLDLEDFLHGLLSMATELVRMHFESASNKEHLKYDFFHP